MNTETLTFGQIVKTYRHDIGLTQDELARRVGCASVTVRKIEHGDLRPSVQIAERLAIMLNIPPEERAAFVRLARAEQVKLIEPFLTPPPKLEEIGTEDLSGRAIRGYALGERIGQGGSGAVYRAIQPVVEREVAIKIILPKYANNPDFIRRFDVEAQLIARLEHPHIVPLYDYWREPDVAYLVMRLLRGRNLQDLLKSGPLPPEEILHILEQIGSALSAAHRAGIIHRDLKPSNVLLDEDRNAYLADFGIATNHNNFLLHQSQLDLIAGTPDYLSPEQIRSEVVGPQTDIYCLGVMMYELLTGAVPFHGPTPIEVMHHHLNAPMPPLAANRGGLSKAIDRVIERATAKNPIERYQNVESLIADFRKSIGIEWQGAISQTPPQTTSETVDLTPADNPYKGLRAFGELDAADFFGRETLIQQLLTRLGEGGDLSRFLAVAGPSGSGKSSVVGAGLVPAIRRGALPGSENWFIVELIPGSNPFEELEAALLRIAVNPPSGLIEWLKKDQHGLLRAINRCLPNDVAVELVLIIDQFEELFTLVQDEAMRAHLLDNLLTAILHEQSRVQIVITLRTDFVDRLLNYVDFGELIRQRTEFVLPLTTDELERAIIGPAERVGLQIEAGVVSAIVRDLSDQPGSLPLLQYALTELFEKRQGNLITKAGYQSIGGVRGALGRRAEEVFIAMSTSHQNMARQLFLRLITLGEGIEDTRRRVLRSELESINSQDNNENSNDAKDMESVLDALGKSRLLTFDHDPRTRVPTIEIAHEALIRTWNRLRDWLMESREYLRTQRQLNLAAKDWVNVQHDSSFLATGSRLARFESLADESQLALNDDERAYLYASIAERQHRDTERATQQRRFIGALLMSLMVAIGLSIFAFAQRREALAQAQIAVSRQLAAQALGEVEKPLGNDEFAALLAIRSLNIEYDPVADAALVKAADRLPTEIFSGHTDEVTSVAFSSDGKYVLTGSTDMTAKLWDVTTDREIRTLNGHTGAVLKVAFSPDGKYLLTGSGDGTAKLWDTATGQELRSLSGNSNEVLSVAFSPNGKYILTIVAEGGAAKVWDVPTGRVIHTFPPGEMDREGVFSPDGRYVLAGGPSHTAKIWEVATGKEVQTLRGHTSWVYSVAFSPDGKYILTGSGDRTTRLWDVATGQEVRSWRGHLGRVLSVAFSPNGKYILTGSEDGTTKLWDFAIGKGRILQGHSGEVYGTAISPDGKYILTSSTDTTAKLWDIGTGRELRTFSAHNGPVYSVNFSPDAKYAVTSGENGVVQVWDIASGKGVHTFVGHSGPIFKAVFSPDGKYVVTASIDTTAKLWEVSTGKEVRTFLGNTAEVYSVAFSPDGKYVVTAGDDATARIWEVHSNQVVQTFKGPDVIYSAIFSPDARSLLTSSGDGSSELWNIATGKEIRTLKGHTNTAYDVAFSPDGKYGVTASADRTAKIWDLATGAELRTLSGHDSAIWSASFSPDGKYILTGSFDGTARLWEVNYWEFVANVCARLLRDFTDEERAQAHIKDQQPTCPLPGR